MTAGIARRRAQEGTCGTCGQPILAGVDADTCGLGARVDPAPLTRTGELLAVIDQRWTYRLIDGRLCHRDRYAIRTGAADVLAEHRCHHPLPATWLAPAPDPAPDKEPF